MSALYVAEYRPRTGQDWKSMLTIRSPSVGAWVSDAREIVEAAIDLCGYSTNEYRVAVYQRTGEA